MSHRSQLISRGTSATILIAIVVLIWFGVSRELGAQATSSPVRDDQGRIVIDSLPYTIDQCGSYLVNGCLVGDEGSHGITILVDDVQLDLGGNTLRGIEGSLSGIYAEPGLTNIHVLNGTVRSWGASGAQLAGTRHAKFTDFRSFKNNGNGIAAGAHCQITDSLAAENRGNGIETGDSACIKACSAEGNLKSGIVSLAGSVVTDSVASANTRDGIRAGGNITNCVGRANGRNGLNGSRGLIADCSASDSGIVEIQGQSFALVQGCNAMGTEQSQEGSSAYNIGKHSMLRESLASAGTFRYAVALSGQRSFVDNCGFTSDESNASVDWRGMENFVGRSFHFGFGTNVSFGVVNGGTNSWGARFNGSSGAANGFREWDNFTRFQ